MSVVSGTIGAIDSAGAQANSAESAAMSQKFTNKQNYKMFQESRGSTGSAVLPLYLKSSDGTSFESKIGTDLISDYNDAAVPLSDFQAPMTKYAADQTSADAFAGDIFNGGITRKLLDEAKPVQEARLASARSDSMDALNKTLASIDAAQAGKGFTGDSYGNRMLQFQGRKAAGESISAASLQNLGENQQIKNYGDVSLPLQNLMLPNQMTRNAEDMVYLPQNNWLNSLKARLDPFNFLRIGAAQPFQYQPLPTAPPIPSTAGLIAQGTSQLGSTALNYYLKNQQQQLLAGLTSPATTSAVSSSLLNPTNAAASLSDYGAATAATSVASDAAINDFAFENDLLFA